MFGISSSEFLIILVIALIVIGPQKLPEMIRTVGKWVGKIQHFTNSVKNELTNEFELNEIKKSIEELKQSSELQKLKEELESTKKGVTQSLRSFESSMNETEEKVKEEQKKLEAYLQVDGEIPGHPASTNKPGQNEPAQITHSTSANAKLNSSSHASVSNTASGTHHDDEAAFDIAFDEAFLKGEAEFITDHEEEGHLLTAPPENYAARVEVDQAATKNGSASTVYSAPDSFRQLLQRRQAEIAAMQDAQVAQQFALLSAKNSRQLLSDDELKRRLTLRQMELNR